ncbi:hypothetical protein Sango_1653900 [Sesamum angolense]|uniref:Uncharacterized protein n=1 Tax=Sesamum angolense TaxID=2727404 RepID=A0AAE1WKK6_9LAMI|nr:hypothetical protein Sango_1653900 [Sesamum angolense]
MRASTISCACHGGATGPHRLPPPFQYYSPLVLRYRSDSKRNRRLVHTRIDVAKTCKLRARANAKAASEWKSHEVAESAQKYYLDEQDVVTFLDPPKELIPLDPNSYNPASYLWKKIEDIPEERRHHLLSLLNPRLISRAWEVAGRRYDDPKLTKKSASRLLSDGDSAGSLELWKCRTSGAPLPIAWINSSQKAIFWCTDGKAYGRLIAKHGWPFDDQVVIYVRRLGPGVVVGQAWQEGKALEQVPKKLFNEMLMVKDYFGCSKKK